MKTRSLNMRTSAPLLLVLLSACQSESIAPLVVSAVDIRDPLPGMTMQAGYMELQNNSTESVRITEIRSPNFRSIEMHTTQIDDNGIAKMRSLKSLSIAPQSNVTFAPGGHHLMLYGAPDTDTDADGNETRPLQFHFFDDDLLLLSIEVDPTNGPSI